jgi:hypothetical protein
MQMIFIKKCFLFAMGSVCRVKRFTTGSKISLKDVRKSQMIPDLLLKWLRQQSKDFYAADFDALVKRWVKCISVGGGYVEKQMFFFQVRISHILRFISTCDLFTDSPSYSKNKFIFRVGVFKSRAPIMPRLQPCCVQGYKAYLLLFRQQVQLLTGRGLARSDNGRSAFPNHPGRPNYQFFRIVRHFLMFPPHEMASGRLIIACVAFSISSWIHPSYVLNTNLTEHTVSRC